MLSNDKKINIGALKRRVPKAPISEQEESSMQANISTLEEDKSPASHIMLST